MNNRYFFRAVKFAFLPLLVLTTLTLTGCPRDFLIPANNLKVATEDLQDVYFLELEISNKARIERGDLEDQIDIWSSFGDEIDVAFLQEMSGKMVARRRLVVPEEISILRRQSFAALDGYASILASLASETPKLRLKYEINIFKGSIQDTLSSVEGIPSDSEYFNKIKQFSEALEVYVGVLTEITDIISRVEFEPALRETIGTASESIISLLRILKQEAVFAEASAIEEIQKSEQILEDYLKSNKFKNASDTLQANLIIKIAEFEILQDEIKKQNVAEAFDAALRAQYSLMETRRIPPTNNWTEGVIKFRAKLTPLKKSIERINASM
jgi:hypothetical protein